MLGIIGGTGFYQLESLDVHSVEEVETPFGMASAQIALGTIDSHPVAFLPRHGRGHSLLPSEINYRANIYALKVVGVTHILSISAVGSLAEEIAPGDLALPSQYIDFTKGRREATFFGKGLAGHVSTAFPVCARLASKVAEAAQHVKDCRIHQGLVYACIEGPRLSTQAESFFLQNAGAQLVGMTNVPEVFLAREAQIAYASLCIVTDYDCWHEDPAHHVTVDQVIQRYYKTVSKVHEVLKVLFADEIPLRSSDLTSSLQTAVITGEEQLTAEHREILATLRR